MTTPTTPSRPPDDAAPAELAWVDGSVLDAPEATVPLTDDGFLRGDAVFESVLVRGGRTHALAGHLARMARSAAAIDLALPDLGAVVDDLLTAWGPRDGSLKLIVTRGGAVRGMLFAPSPWPETISLAVIDTPWRTPLSGVKTLSYAANQWAKRQAVHRGADDALIVDDGVVHELATGTLVAVHDGVCTSPDPDVVPILASVTLAELRRVVDVAAGTLDLAALGTADEVFVVSATRPVIGVERLVLAEGEIHLTAPGAVTRTARDRLAHHIQDTLDPR